MVQCVLSGELKGHEGAILAVRFNTDGRYCLTCGRDRTLRLWNPHNGLFVKSYLGHGRDVRDVAVSSDNGRLASCGGDRQVFLWDVASGKTLRKFRGHDSDVNSVKFNEISTVVVTAGYDKCIKVWDHRSNSIDAIQVMDQFSDSVTSVTLTVSEIIAGSVDGSVKTFDIRNGRMVSDNLGQPVNCTSLSRDKLCILAGCLDSKLRLLDRATGELLNEYSGHVNNSYKMDSCVSNDDAFVLSGSEDGRICFWDLVDATLTTEVLGHTSGVTCVAFHPSKSCFLSSSVDGTCKFWTL